MSDSFNVVLSPDDGEAFSEAWNWCKENCGPHRRLLSKDEWRWWTRPNADSNGALVEFCFKFADDAVRFKLTWG